MSSTRLVIRNDLLPSLVKPIIKTEYFPTPTAPNVYKTSIICVFCSLQKLQDNWFSNFHLTENQSPVSCICSLKIFPEASKSEEFEKTQLYSPVKSNQLLSLCLHFLCCQRKVFPKMTVHLSTLCLRSLIFPDTCPRVNLSEEVALILKLTFNDTHISKGWILNILIF